MNRPRAIALLAILAVLAFVLSPRHSSVAPSNQAIINPACRIARNVTQTPQPDPNQAAALTVWHLAGDEKQPGSISGPQRQRYVQAFALLQKIDSDDTAGLTALPALTPNIDTIIDRRIAELTWARSMLGIFYEQGRADGRRDPRQAAVYFQKAIDTSFSDDRGCAHATPISDSARRHYVAVLVYDLPSEESRARAMAVLEQGGPSFASDLYLLGRNLLPANRYEYFTTNLDAMAEGYRHPYAKTIFSQFFGGGIDDDAIIVLLGRTLLWCAGGLVLFVGGVGLFRYIRRRQGYKVDTSLYRTVFAIYDVVHGIVARFGLVAEGLIGCFFGLSMLFGSFVFFTFDNATNVMILVSGVTAFLGGLAKLVEAARVSMKPHTTPVHGAARPAAEPEAQAAARGRTQAPDFSNRSFSD